MSKQKTNLRNIVVAITLLTLGGAYFHKANADVDVSSFPGLQHYLNDADDYYSDPYNLIHLIDNDISFDPQEGGIVFGSSKTVDGGNSWSLIISGYSGSDPVMSWGSGSSYQTVKFQNITLDIANNSVTVFSVGANKTLSLENTTMTATGNTNSIINVGGGGEFFCL